MSTSSRLIALAATLLALSGVILAAMGSHLFDMNGMQATWQIASNIHLFSAAGLLGLAALLARLDSRWLIMGACLVVLGSVVFCGSIYLHVITGQTFSGVTPSGGLLLMSGWLMAALAFVRKT
jgi:uncharacterized membrane protein YgdD (TMEM256/DUF423 family)